ncbi:hypothetical protein PLESTB_001292700 [Pleodorina starrii]|uniref:Uncharacterized protein n=1 Tax=Pleodorina starrii TaxID=330485 RepID=A0A9W6F6T7_9CHLO|nr:hypothetical protein PLESTB_001292700 [Pleodorina starrii]
MGCSSSRVDPEPHQQQASSDDKPAIKDKPSLKAVHEGIASQVQAPTTAVAALGQPHLTAGNQASQALGRLPACLRDLHHSMPPAIRRANMRLLKIAAVLKCSQLKVYENVDAEAEALQVSDGGGGLVLSVEN